MKLWTKCPRCRHLCKYKLTDDGEGIALAGPDCDYCENSRHVIVQLGTLAMNLAVVGALCHAWWMGAYSMCEAAAWHPGCGYAHDDYLADLRASRIAKGESPDGPWPVITTCPESDIHDPE